MPIYTFKNKTTEETWTEVLTISEMEKRLEDDANLDVLPGAPIIGDAWRLGVKKADNQSQMKEVIDRVKKNHPHHTIGKQSRHF